MKRTTFSREHARRLIVPGIVVLFLVIAFLRIYYGNLRPHLDRVQVRNTKSHLFSLLTKQTLVGTAKLGGAPEDDSSRDIYVQLSKDSPKPIDPAEPAFYENEYRFVVVLLRPLSPELDPENSDYAVSARGSFQDGRPEYHLEADGFDLVASIVSGENSAVRLKGKIKDPWRPARTLESVSFDVRAVTEDEFREMQSRRKTLRADTIAERQRRAVDKWKSWEDSIRNQADLRGSITLSDSSAKVAGRSTLPVRAKLVSSGSAMTLSLSVDKFPRQYLSLAGELHSERRYDEKPPKFSFRPQERFRRLVPYFIDVAPDVAPATISGRIEITLEGSDYKGEITLAPMTAGELDAERREEQRIALEAKEKLIRLQKGIYLLNRRGGLEATLEHSDGSRLPAKFETLMRDAALSSLRPIEDIEIKYQLVVMGKEGKTFGHILEGKLTNRGTKEEAVVLRLVPGGVNPLFDGLTVKLVLPMIEQKTYLGGWTAHVPPASFESALAGLINMGALLDGKKARVPTPKGTDVSGTITLRGVSYSEDDVLLAPRPETNRTPSVVPESYAPPSPAASPANRMAVVDDPDGTTNLRESGPDSRVLASVPSTEVVEVLEERRDGWLRVRRSTGQTGYVHIDKLKARDDTAHARIRAFIAEHHAKASRRDVDEYAKDYDTEVDFLDEGKRTREHLAKDWRKYFGDTAELEERVLTTPEVKQVRYGHYVVTYRLLSKRKRAGSPEIVEVVVDSEIKVRMSDAPPVITFQRQKRRSQVDR